MLRSRIRSLVQLIATTLTMWSSFVLLGGKDHFLFLWPLTAVQLAIALADWRGKRERLFQLLACCIGGILATSLLGMPLLIGVSFAVIQTLEVGCIAAILTQHIGRFDDLKRRGNVLRFGLAALLVPSFAVGLAAIPISALTHTSILTAWTIAAPSDALGIVVILPALLFLSSGEYRSFRKLRPHLPIGIPVLVLFVGAIALLFFQHWMPFLFLVFLPLIIVAFVLGLEGSVFAAMATACIGGWATIHGHGPISLMPGVSPELRVMILQFFLATVVAVALPVGALLDEQRQAQRVAHEGQSIYSTLIEYAEDMIVLSAMDGTRRFVSPAVTMVTGWSPAEYLALGQLGGIHPDDRDFAQTVINSLAGGKTHHAYRHRILCKDGCFRWVEAQIRGYTDAKAGCILGYVATIRDISEQMQNEESWSAEKAALARENQELHDLALKDELTGVPNRRGLNLALEYEIARRARSATPISLLMIDVDYFKKYNDLFGHLAGDECLRKLAQTMYNRVRRISDTVARVGGEEFAILLPETDEAGAWKVGQDILRTVADLNIPHPDSPHGSVSVSVGIATWPPFYKSEIAQLIQQADRALYQSKRLGRNSISFSENRSRIS